MSEARSETEALRVRSRSLRNIWNLALIISILFLVLAPFVLILSYIVTAALTGLASAGSQILAGLASSHRVNMHGALAIHRVHSFPDQALILHLMPWTVEFLTALLAIVLWGMSSATEAGLLARMVSRPARTGGPGEEAIRSLMTLSLMAGIPPPKLYIVQCRFPTTFSYATDHRHGTIAITTGALDLLEDRELDTLLAHELSHIANRDGRLEAILTALAVLTEYPSRMFQKKSQGLSLTGSLALLEVLLSPLSLYVFFASPLLNSLIRAMVLRSREHSADAEAALLTGDPESLANALGKIGGVATTLGVTTVSSLPAHISLYQRVERLMQTYPALGFKGLDAAIAKGKQYARERPGMAQDPTGLAESKAEVTGRVYQLISNEAVPLFDGPGPGALVRRRMEPGELLVVFDTRGKMRQVNTAEEVFGYLRRQVQLRTVEGVFPQEVYDPVTRAALVDSLRLEATTGKVGLTSRQVWLALGFGTAVFAGTTALLFVFASR